MHFRGVYINAASRARRRHREFTEMFSHCGVKPITFRYPFTNLLQNLRRAARRLNIHRAVQRQVS